MLGIGWVKSRNGQRVVNKWLGHTMDVDRSVWDPEQKLDTILKRSKCHGLGVVLVGRSTHGDIVGMMRLLIVRTHQKGFRDDDGCAESESTVEFSCSVASHLKPCSTHQMAADQKYWLGT